MEIGARQRAAQLDGRNGEVVAVHRFCQIHEARAAAVELTNGNGRNKGDAGACLDIEIQRVGQQAAVLFAARQLQLRLGLKEVKDVQLQFKGVELIILEGVDLALDIGKLQRHHLRGGKAARGVDAVDLELIPLQAVTQLFQRKFRAVEDGLKADLAAEHKVSRRVGSRLFQLHRGVGDVYIDDGIVFGRINVKCKALFRERNAQCAFRAGFRLVEFEGRRTQAHAALLHGSILVDNEFAAAIFVPRCRDGGRQQRRPACKGEVFPVFALIIAVDESDGVLLVLTLQRLERRVVRHMLHRHAAVGENGQPLGVDGGIDLVRFTGDGLRQLRQAAEAPEEVGFIFRIILRSRAASNIALTAHIGIRRFVAGPNTDHLRQIDADRRSAGGGDRLPIVIRQSHKGIGPVVAVRIDLGDVIGAPITPRRIVLRRIQIFHLAGEHGVFGGKHFPRCMIVDGAAQPEGGAVSGVSVTHGGKAAEGIAPSHLKLNAQSAISIHAGDLDIVNARQHAPCAGPALPELHDLIVDRGRSGGSKLLQIDCQVVLHLDGYCRAVWCFVHEFHTFRT